jgi:WD40 repeat protein
LDLEGRSLLTVRRRSARWYRLSTPEKLSLPGHSAGAGPVAFSPDGRCLASVADRVVRLCDAQTGHIIWETNDLPGVGHCLSYSPDGRWLATGDWDTEMVCIRDARTGQRLFELGTNRVGRSWSVQFSPDSRYFATATEPYGLRIWTLEPGMARAGANGFGPKLLGSWAVDPTSEIVAAHARDPHSELSFLGRPNSYTPLSVAFAPGSRSVAFWCLSSVTDGSLYVWDFERSAQPREVASHIRASGQCESFAPDGRSLFTLGTNGTVVTVEVASGKQAPCGGSGDSEPSSPGLCLSPDGTKLAVSIPSGLGLNIRDAATGNLLFSLPPESGVISEFAWSADSRRLAISRDNGNIAIWDFETVGQILAQLGLNP